MTSNTPLPPPTPDPHRKTPELDAETAQHSAFVDTKVQGAPGDAQPEDKPAKLDLSFTQIMGGALAAMTAAALGSRLGVGGTIVGAAVASIIAAVAGSLYTASLRHTREKVKTVWSGRVAGTDTPASIDRVPETLTWDLPQAQVPATRAPRPKLPWKGILVGAFATFAIAAFALTGFELLSGNALSGGGGTTIERVSQPNKASSPSKKATPTESESASPSESETPEAAPTPEPTPSATEEPSVEPPAPSASDTPTAGTEEETPAPSETPSEQPGSEETPEG